MAIKSLHASLDADRSSLLQEAAIMAQFQHPYVTGLVGVVTVGGLDAIAPFEMRLLPTSATYKVPEGETTMPPPVFAKLNWAAAPVPSAPPAKPGVPPMVVTTPAGVTMRMVFENSVT